MRILVTGGAGFIGSHVADAAVAQGHQVAVLDDLSSGKQDNVPASALFFCVDVRDGPAVEEVFARFCPDAVTHQAAQASVAVSVRDPLGDASVNVLGTLTVLDAARARRARFVYASTGGALYGEVPEERAATTDWTPSPLSPYAASKLAAEHYVRLYGALHGMRVTVLRYANVYGPRQSPHGEAGVVAIFLGQFLRGEPLGINARRVLGDDGCVRDYVDVRDVVRANLAALEGRLDGRVLNVGTGVGTSTRALAQRIVARGFTGDLVDRPHRQGDLERSVLDPADMIATLGEPIDLDRGLAHTADWFRRHAH